MVKQCSVALVDFDNSLFFVDESTRRASKEMLGKSMERKELRKLEEAVKYKVYALAYSKYSYLSVPNKMLIRRLRKMSNYKIVVITARPKPLREITLEMLKKHDIPFDALITRDKKAEKLSDEEWKLRLIRSFLRKYGRVEYYEDKKDNVKYVKEGIEKIDRLDIFLVMEGGVKKI
jgi:hypothetical protein